MSQEPKPAPLVALVTRWAMLQRRRGVYVPAEVVNLLVCLAERHNAEEGCSRPGNFALAWDTGFASKDTLRRWLAVAVDLGAVTYRAGAGRGKASEVRFTSDVREAPQLDYLAQLDQVRICEAATKDQRVAFPARPRVKPGGDRKGRSRLAHLEHPKGRSEASKRAQQDEKRAQRDPEKDYPTAPPTAVPLEPLEPLRPSAASISPADEQTNGNGALTEDEEAPLSRIEQFRKAFQGSGNYVPLTEAEEAGRRQLLAEQAALLRAAGGGE